MNLVFTEMESPIGKLRLEARDGALCGVILPTARHPVAPSGTRVRGDATLVLAARQLREYFDGVRKTFDIPLCFEGSTFQKIVWKSLLEIPFAETRSYGEQARALGRPTASRAVGGANGRNPIAIVVPCHRVIGSDGSLTGYGGGETMKRWLLDHEDRVVASAQLRHARSVAEAGSAVLERQRPGQTVGARARG